MTLSKKYIYCILILLSIMVLVIGYVFYTIFAPYNSNPVVKTKLGRIQGLHASDGYYDMYLGIPYAQVNKSNVFGPAIPLRRFKEPFKANNDSAICPQFEEFNKTIAGTLDCLRLNIYTPKSANPMHLHSVLVFLHGGDYKSGFGGRYLYGPKYLIKHGIVFVTLNYRVGPYGFLCSNIPQIANQGLKDQILALKWIKDNISHFGGDSNNVTIAGVGSGGESANLHLMYGKEQLFQNAIIESGIYIDDRAYYNTSNILKLAEELGLKTNKEIEALNYLNREDVNSVIASSMKLRLNYRPCIEKVSKDAFITNKTSKSHSPNVKKARILIGLSNREMLREYAHRNLNQRKYKSIFNDEIKRHFNLTDEQQKVMETNVRHFYIGDDLVGEKTKQSVVDFMSDLHYNYPARRMINKYFEDDAKKVYCSVFSYEGGRNFAKTIYNISMDGATKYDVLGYLFDTPYVKKPDTQDKRIIDYVTTLWANFVKYGNPNPEKTALLPVKWEAATKDKINYLIINSVLTAKLTPFYNRTAYWDVFYKLNGKKERVSNKVQPWTL